ncbi:YslB family protein [Brevibacillus laterosporus]|uniref:YslB family protein n=1 Tax=Brevibacillus laterosporus TaxID=1465 RepID=UPI00215CE8A1|nr:YslB family protein [Brevibacillus laterosporus]MCR8994132.1 YslB family protein [Brevibacillus laterosporus]
MRQATDILQQLLPEFSVYDRQRLQQMNMPFAGHLFFRNVVTQELLGDCEAPILYWMGKEIGETYHIHAAEDLILAFIQLGLGKLELTLCTARQIEYLLTHPHLTMQTTNRLERTLQFETGFIAGSIGKWLERESNATLTLLGKDKKKEPTAHIQVVISG